MSNEPSASALATELQVQVFGEDLDGRPFLEQTRTLLLTRDGATIPMACKLAPDSELMIRNPATNEEALARVVGHMRDAVLLHVYGIVFIDPSVNLWQVEFPHPKPANNIVMECIRCHAVEYVALNEIEMAIFESTRSLMRECRCENSSTTWKRTDQSVTQPGATQFGVNGPLQKISSMSGMPAPVSGERRKGKRTAMKASGCIRWRGREVFFECEDVSRGGFRFKGMEVFPAGIPIEAAVPYAKNGVNIFVAARIAYHQELSGGFHRCGVAYVGSIKSSNSKF